MYRDIGSFPPLSGTKRIGSYQGSVRREFGLPEYAGEPFSPLRWLRAVAMPGDGRKPQRGVVINGSVATRALHTVTS
jgi:hypothetical protein